MLEENGWHEHARNGNNNNDNGKKAKTKPKTRKRTAERRQRQTKIMCQKHYQFWTVCLHYGRGHQTDYCQRPSRRGRCYVPDQIELCLGWCPHCVESVKRDYIKQWLCSRSIIWRYWLWVTREASPNMSLPIKPYMIGMVDPSEINNDSIPRARKTWTDCMIERFRVRADCEIKLMADTWYIHSRAARKEMVQKAQDVTLEWADGFILT
ncbi:hypothetical protein DCS_04918 [Drechmeria coniospora]|uniref:Uncharacterized protein n=1 Tax=Drechmeria coniospora TaxID=98403 RepID=A0A151GLB7_DRECN|nr:hypothetical protein DCS_04918 [Drechmeria coniospora]KYK57905.1 hypothetical protein DCS_04918 [Drechmeria coniospora]ODA83254.1 hypothetical protein RJ55_01766 [Drechmeria coniospora]